MIPLFDTYERRRLPAVTTFLVFANLAVFVYQLLLFQQGEIDQFIREFAFTPSLFLRDVSGRSVTILTSMFMHGGWAHLLFNLWFLWLFGKRVENHLGGFRYLLLYLCAGIAAAAAQFLAGPNSSIPMVGASGAIAGVLGAYLLFFPRAIIFTFVPIWFAPIIPVPAFIFLIIWFYLQIWNGIGSLMATEETGGVAWWAHLGGFLAGFFLSRRLDRGKSKRFSAG